MNLFIFKQIASTKFRIAKTFILLNNFSHLKKTDKSFVDLNLNYIRLVVKNIFKIFPSRTLIIFN